MSLDDIDWLFEKIANETVCTPEIKLYIFGSVLRKSRAASDIDILFLYNDPEQIKKIKMETKKICLDRPVHMLFMTYSEEIELGFIKGVNGIEIFPNNHL